MVAVRLVILYGSKYWEVKRRHKKKINVEKMRMLRWMNSNTLEDQITNEIILGKLDLTP